MAYTGNYLIQARQARERFTHYDQQSLIRKFSLQSDSEYIYVNLLCYLYRIQRTTGNLEYLRGDSWEDGNSFEEVMTLFDLLCDSKENRHLSGNFQNMQSFGLMFHRNLLEQRNPEAERFDRDPASLQRACLRLGGKRLPGADISFGVELFDGLEIVLRFWRGDEEFAPRLQYFWDQNAMEYLRYETMYYAVALLLRRIKEQI